MSHFLGRCVNIRIANTRIIRHKLTIYARIESVFVIEGIRCLIYKVLTMCSTILLSSIRTSKSIGGIIVTSHQFPRDFTSAASATIVMSLQFSCDFTPVQGSHIASQEVSHFIALDFFFFFTFFVLVSIRPLEDCQVRLLSRVRSMPARKRIFAHFANVIECPEVSK